MRQVIADLPGSKIREVANALRSLGDCPLVAGSPPGLAVFISGTKVAARKHLRGLETRGFAIR